MRPLRKERGQAGKSRGGPGSAPGQAARFALLLALVFAVLGIWLGALYRHDLRLLAETAHKVEAGQLLSPEQRLIRYINFTAHGLRKPRIQDLPPLVRLYYRWNPEHPGAGDVLRWGADYRGGCGSFSRVAIGMLRSSGIPCHALLQLDDAGHDLHTVVESKIGGRWVVADAYYGIVFRRGDGALATVEDMQRDQAAYLAQVEHVPGYDIKHYNFLPVTRLNWNKVPFLFPAIRSLLVRLIGESKVQSMVRPDIWMWPQETYSLLCLLLAGAFGLLAVRLGRRGR